MRWCLIDVGFQCYVWMDGTSNLVEKCRTWPVIERIHDEAFASEI